jgi:acyl-CoA thioesterase-1
VLVAVAAVQACGAGSAPAPPRAASTSAEPAPPTVAFLGDSYTVGVGDEGGEGYVEATADALGWSPPVVEAESGTGYVAEGPDTARYEARLAAVVEAAPDVVVVQGSTNDVGYPVGDVLAAASSLYGRLATELPEAEVVVVGPLAAPAVDDAGLRAVRDALAEAADAAGVFFIDPVAEGWLWPADGWFADVLHPNDAGYGQMAERLALALHLRGF